MGNCLKTQLKGNVNNISLIKMGEYPMQIIDNADSTVTIQLNRASENTVRCAGDCYFVNLGDHTTSLGKEVTGNIVEVHGNGYVFFNNKYEMGTISAQSPKLVFDIKEILKYAIEVVSCQTSKAYGDISGLKTNATQFVPGYNVTGSAETLIKESPNLTRFLPVYGLCEVNLAWLEGKRTLQCDTFNNVKGDIMYLADGNNSQIYVETAYRGSITGSIEGFVNRAINTWGKTSGTFTVSNAKELVNVTFENVSLAENANVPNGNPKFTWDAQGNITWSAN